MIGSGRGSAALNRLCARALLLGRPASGFLSPPEPRSIGRTARGRQLVAGNFLFAGRLIEAPGAALFDILPPDTAYRDALQDFGWLDDLAAAGDAVAQQRAQDWTFDWIARYGTGKGPGWTPALTGRRVLRWVHHGVMLLDGRDPEAAGAFFRALTRQVRFLGARWQAAPAGLPRFEALTALISARLSLGGLQRRVGPAMAALDRDCAAVIDARGAIPSRNPEELLEVFSLLTWAAEALRGANRVPTPGHLAAIARIAPTLRALRHADGGLARFHGGGRGIEGRLDHALAASGARATEAPRQGARADFLRAVPVRAEAMLTSRAQSGPAQSGPAQSGPAQSGPAQSGSARAGPAQSGPARAGPARAGPARAVPARAVPARAGSARAVHPQVAPAEDLAMGYARLTGGRTTLIADAADPPPGAVGAVSHASTLAFELTSGRRPVIVSCGPGAPFGSEWQRASRATASHSTLAIEGYSSSRLGTGGAARRLLPDLLSDCARVTQARLTRGAEGTTLALAHDGWAATHGLIHARELHLGTDGRSLRGEDILGALGPAEKKRLGRVLAGAKEGGLRFALRFHLHPDVDPAIDLGGTAVSLTLKSGEVWVFRHDGAAELSVEPSVYLDKGRLAPRTTQQVVLAAALNDFACQIDWTLAKAQDTPLAIRDLDRESLPAGS